jgi:hypothetical protein
MFCFEIQIEEEEIKKANFLSTKASANLEE